MEKIRPETQKITLLGMLLAVISVLTWVEHILPPLPLVPPNIRLGLSNIVTMYALFFIGAKPALALAALKSLFVLLTRGVTAGVLSFCGGMLSLLVMLALLAIFGKHISYLLLSVAGAVAHNMGQMMAASVLVGTNLLPVTIPILLIGGVAMGSITGCLLRVVLPVFQKTLGGKL